jgi:hypothetical protein
MINKKILLHFAILALAFGLIAQSTMAGIVKRFNPEENKQDLLLLGFGELTMHALNVSGNTAAFEAGNPDYDEDFAANYRASLLANGNINRKFFIDGTIVYDSRLENEYRTNDPRLYRLRLSMRSTEPLWDGWRFTGQGYYDPQRLWEYGNLDKRLLYQPQVPSRLELSARLESDKHGYVEGGTIHPSFGDNQFTLNNRAMFGAFANLYDRAVGIEAIGGKLEGKEFREGTTAGIRANGTTGPYDLSFAPLVNGSEEVKIEVRDRFNETTVLSSQTLVRDIDYDIDYDRGRVILFPPVASETIESNPVYIVITYDYTRDANDDLAGARVRLTPDENIEIGGSYLHRFIDNKAVGAGIDEPEELFAGDFKITDEKWGEAFVEVAGSQKENDSDNYQALRAGVTATPLENLKLTGNFQNIDDQFQSFTNSDLDPVKNQRRLGLGGQYDLTARQQLRAGFAQIRTIDSAGDYNYYEGERDEKIISAGYSNKVIKQFGFDLGFERRDIENISEPSTEDTYQNRAILNLGGYQDSLNYVGRLDYGLHLEHITFRNNNDSGAANTNTEQVALSLAATPRDGYRFSLSQKMDLRKDRDQNIYDDRKDVTLAQIRVQPHRNLSALLTGEYKRYTVPGDDFKLWPDDPTRIERAGNFAIEYIPVDKIKALGKFGRYEDRVYSNRPCLETYDDFALAQLTYFHTHHLSFNAESEFRHRAQKDSVKHYDKIWDMGLKVNWNRDRFTEFTAGMIRRWQIDRDPPLEKITSESYILLFSGAVGLGKGFFTRGSVKSILLGETIEDEKTHTILELGYENPQWCRISGGYERIESDPDDYPDRYYRGQGGFIRLVGKF